MESILVWVKSGLLFGILASVIIMLSPEKAYVKHISMVVGLLFILVMLHPLMELFQIDRETYASYIRNYLSVETDENGMSKENLEYYEETCGYQLTVSLQGYGYSIERAYVNANEEGEIEKVKLIVGGELRESEKLELYLKNLFGEDVKIRYEVE